MTPAAAGREAPGRPAPLDPFCFPASTDFRFLLLVVSVLGAGIVVYLGLHNLAPDDLDAWTRAAAACRAQAGAGQALTEAGQLALGRCEGPAAARFHHLVAAAAVAGLMLAAGALLLLHPRWKRWRARLAPIEESRLPELAACLRGLSREAGLARPPAFLWNPLGRGGTAVAFGLPGRHAVALSGGLAARFVTDPPAFRAVVLHELAHIRNGDVTRTYFAITVWWAFVALGVVPFIVAEAVARRPDTVWSLGWRFAALTALVYLTRNSVLRARERYADVRASRWDGPGGALRRVLERLRGSRWWELVGVHPAPAERRRLLDDTTPLFRPSAGEALAAGCAVGVALLGVEVVVDDLVGFPTGFVVASLAFGSLAAGVVGTGIWRDALAALARGRRPASVVPAGVGLGAGFVLGLNVSLPSLALGSSHARWLGFGLTPLDLAFDAVLVLGVIVVLAGVQSGAMAWLPLLAGRSSPRLGYRLGLGVATLALATWLTGMLVIGLFGTSLGAAVSAAARTATGLPATAIDLAETVALVFAGNPLATVAVAGLWAFPLAASWRSRPEAAPRWAYLDATGPALAAGGAAPSWWLAPACGALAWAGFLVASASCVAVGLGLNLRAGGMAYLDLALDGPIAMALGAQAAAAIAASVLATRAPLAHGLFAAFVAGSLAALTLDAAAVAVGLGEALRGPVGAAIVLSALVNVGAAGAAGAAWLVRLAASRRDAPATPAAGPSTPARGRPGAPAPGPPGT
jgi:Zn-dependent protease with chaperone function